MQGGSEFPHRIRIGLGPGRSHFLPRGIGLSDGDGGDGGDSVNKEEDDDDGFEPGLSYGYLEGDFFSDMGDAM